MYIYNIIWINDHCRYCSLIVSFLFQLWVSKLRLEISNKKMSLFPSKILATHAVLENVVAGMPSRGNPLDPPLPGNRGNVAMISIPAKSLRLYRYKKKYFGHWDNHDHNWGGIHLHGMDVEPEAISLCRSYIFGRVQYLRSSGTFHVFQISVWWSFSNICP